MARVVVGFPIEHPLDALRVQWQAQPWLKNEAAVVKHVVSTKGITRGLYAGALPNFTRLIARNSYKYPLLVGLPELQRSHMGTTVRENPKLAKLITGSSVAFVESLITCPLDRMKVHLMTQ